ncbi:hypothetical protein O6H91_05G084700 [Diphasiastrum complanatum]|uniref:Uncharacterized protein n=2 Tax=Diphasiastrum complanatum TaxID=34168 RepID=A0ACC2DQ85_DIPCM|nr:hypothetical protein O6H91_05G037900 [Diphasiastrum complanatum]KAJ7556451.1 hypothetical protein O6H91_05G084700 [Diphasiastrum complanatum]
MKALSTISASSLQLNHDLLKWFVILCSALFFLASTATGQQQPNTTAYELLELNGFPAGLLPHTVVSATFHSNGQFEVHLSGKCSVDVPGEYPVSYGSRITGVLSKGRLSGLSGITVKAFFVWWSITEIFVTGQDLVFTIGIASASYPASNFNDSPVCGNSMISTM